ncbi:MAG: tRNA (guanosine(46)-N7)-methyltransferase TrmB [Lachnospiraceae bacterium]|nr:tRNA (guanosine(46)-N7)-methyltransferase TrmB [Lachnospiraceae bacterium]
MRLRKVKGAEEKVASSSFVAHNAKENKGKWKQVFGNDKPIRLEIGMGKGRFITTLSKENQDVNYLGLERFQSVLVRAIEKREEDPEPNANLLFLCEDANDLTDIFEEGEIDEIYLNFSDPWPKARHAERRLTSGTYLAKYDKVIKKTGKVVFKTDNTELFDYSLESFQEHGWKIDSVIRDLHNSELAEGNIMTEYEIKFGKLGKKICRLEASR